MKSKIKWPVVAFLAGLILGVVAALAIAMYGVIPFHRISLNGSLIPNVISWFNESYRSHRDDLVAGANVASQIRGSTLAGLIGLIVFLFLSVPKKVTEIRALFTTMVGQYTLPQYKKLGVSNDDQPYARALVFFYCLFLLYQIVSFPLTSGNPSLVSFYSDLLFQTVLIGFIFGAYWRLKSRFRQKAKDPERRDKLSAWLNSKLGDMDISTRSLFWVPVSAFAVAFGPALIVHLPSILDAVVQTDTGLIADLHSFFPLFV